MKVFARVVTYTLIAVILALALGLSWQGGLFWWVIAAVVVVGICILVGQWINVTRELETPFPYTGQTEDDLYAQDVLDYHCAGHGHNFERVNDLLICTNCTDVVRAPIDCGGRHRYEVRGQSLHCTVCGHRANPGITDWGVA